MFIKKTYSAEVLDPGYFKKLLLDSSKANMTAKILPYEVFQNSATFKALPNEQKSNEAIHLFNGILYNTEEQFKLFPKFAEETKSDALLLIDLNYAFGNNPNKTFSEPVEGLTTYMTINLFNKTGQLIYSNQHVKTIEIGKPEEDPADFSVAEKAGKVVDALTFNFGTKVSKALDPHIREQSKLILEDGLKIMAEKLDLKPKKK